MDFYYDSINMRKPVEGAVVGGTFTPASTTDNVGVVMDDSTQLTTNFTGSTPKGVRFLADSFAGTFVYNIDEYPYDVNEYLYSIGTAGIGNANYVIINSNGMPNVEVWASDNSITGYTRVFNGTIEDNTWSINQLDSLTTASYFVVQFTGTYNVDVSEIIIANKISDVYRYDLNWNEQLRPNVSISGSYGGGEFTNKDNVNYEFRSLSWKTLNQTYADKLKSLRDAVYNTGKHFLIVESTDRRFGKLVEDVKLIETGYRHYSLNLAVRSVA